MQLPLIEQRLASEPALEVRTAAVSSLKQIKQRLMWGDLLGQAFTKLSLCSMWRLLSPPRWVCCWRLWGISLMLIQLVCMLFGAQNLEVANPASLQLLPYNCIALILFMVAVLTLI